MSNAITTDPSTTIRPRMSDGASFATAIGATCARQGSVFGGTSVLIAFTGTAGRGGDMQTYIRPSAETTLMGHRAWGPPI